jgi:hypothetical protein
MSDELRWAVLVGVFVLANYWGFRFMRSLNRIDEIYEIVKRWDDEERAGEGTKE